MESLHGRRKARVFSHRVLAAILNPLAAAGISILSISTFDTDYVLVRTPVLEKQRPPCAGISS